MKNQFLEHIDLAIKIITIIGVVAIILFLTPIWIIPLIVVSFSIRKYIKYKKKEKVMREYLKKQKEEEDYLKNEHWKNSGIKMEFSQSNSEKPIYGDLVKDVTEHMQTFKAIGCRTKTRDEMLK